MNPIEGLWCDQKQFIRKNTDQTFLCMKKLLIQSRIEFENKGLNIKLNKRFWRVIKAYKNGAKYDEVLRTYFSGHSKENNESHKKISNSNLN
jgi:AICAR transformylase/IMP cyclohydrolase PurH